MSGLQRECFRAAVARLGRGRESPVRRRPMSTEENKALLRRAWPTSTTMGASTPSRSSSWTT